MCLKLKKTLEETEHSTNVGTSAYLGFYNVLYALDKEEQKHIQTRSHFAISVNFYASIVQITET